ncbi:MAG: outer membrane protein assembly factor BamA [Bacteroidia bacterium]
MVSVLLFASCKSSKLVPENEYLLQKNRVIVVNKTVSETDLMDQVRHKPNRRLLVVKAHMWANHFGKQVGLNKIGEPPIVVDTNRVRLSAENMQRYMVKRGYFDNTVTYKVEQTKFSKAFNLKKKRVTYYVTEGKPYVIKRVKYRTTSTEIRALIDRSKSDSKIEIQKPVDFVSLGDERARISNLLRNNGFYSFNPSYISIELDTAILPRQVFIDININDPDSTTHKKKSIGSVLVVYHTGSELNDTIRNVKHNITFVMNGMDLSPAVIGNNILLQEGDYFSQLNLATTYERLINLNLFSNVGVDVKEAKGGKGLLDVIVVLKPAPKFDFVWQPQVISTEQRFNNTQSSRNYGLANEFSLRNKNVFHNGEEFNINIRTALETQFTSDSNSAFSAFIQELNTELKIPQLLFFRKKGNALKVNSVSTNFNASYLFETNPFYRRNFFPLSYTYELADKRFRFTYSPLLVSLNEATYKQKLFNQASESYLQTLERIFTNNLITSQQIGGFYTTKTKDSKRYWSIHSNLLEVSGIWLPRLTAYGKAFGVNHSTFIRTDADLRFHVIFNPNNELVLRGFGGVGVPIGDRSVLPYERRFTSGGSNYLRGWRLRTVGPGAFSAEDNLQLTRTGELGLLGNLEYRFNIIRNVVDLNGALFVDVGNVWNLKKDTLFPGGEFQPERFLQEFAINSGIGLRVDADFLLLRFDWGVPLWDPNFPFEDRAVIQGAFKNGWIFKRPVWNIAVGYPF